MERIIPGFSSYIITINGEVRSVDRVVVCSNGKTQWTQRYHGKILKWRVNKYRNNETTVNIVDDSGECRPVKISHLVAKTFPEICGEWFDGCEVDHIDTDRFNNNAHNLRVTDKKGNMANPITREHCRVAWTDERREFRRQAWKNNNPKKKQ